MYAETDCTRRRGWTRRLASWPLLAALLMTILPGCGGGGSGGNEADPATAVSVALVEPTQPYVATVPLGQPAPDLRLVGRASGNLAALNGRTIIIVVEDPAGFFRREPFVFVDSSTGQTTVDLFGDRQTTPGHFTGQLRVLACLDAACKSQLKGSPMTLAYDVTVQPGLTLSASAVEVTSTFGDPAFTRSLTATPPPGDTTVQVDYYSFVGGNISYFFSASAGAMSAGSVPVTLDFVRMPPGTYEGLLTIVATGYIQTIPVRHTVADNPALAAAASPASFSFTQAVGDPTQHPTEFYIVPRNGESLGFLGVVYLESPPASAGHAMHDHWLLTSVNAGQNFVSPCDTFRADCLPAGTYRAASRWQVNRADGSKASLEVPFTLTLTP